LECLSALVGPTLVTSLQGKATSELFLVVWWEYRSTVLEDLLLDWRYKPENNIFGEKKLRVISARLRYS
tara:strand:- start:200 stop:406 length:207 start_codon:yes stop_codon:yes gene_type:complete